MTGAAPPAALLEDWALRPWALAALLGLCGGLLHLLLGTGAEDVPWRAGGAAFVGFGGLALAFGINLRRPIEAAAFAVIVGAVMGGIAYQVVLAEGRVSAPEFAFAAGVLFALLALPLFQADFHRLRFATDYRTTHFHVWADAISGGGALAFTGLSWLLLLLLDQLFDLVGIGLLGDLIDQSWFDWTWSGAAFGAGLGGLRNNLKIIGALQNVVLVVFALLAVPLAVALVIFLAALAASGGKALWEASLSATPVLLACAAGSFVLFNAIIRDSDEERSASRVMQIAAAVLAAGIFPLTVFAAISMGIRIAQYGLAPERIWGLIAIAVATAYGLACWVALARGRRAGWSRALRAANLHLAAGVCAVALVLSVPVWDFGAIAARNQVARLHAGKVTAEEFDFAALRWDFGDAGIEALERLARGEGEAAQRAAEALARETRLPSLALPRKQAEANLRVQPDNPQLRALVLEYLRANSWRCQAACVALDLGAAGEGRRRVALVEGGGYEIIRLPLAQGDALDAVGEDATAPLLDGDSTVAIRELTRRYVTIDGQPVGPPLD